MNYVGMDVHKKTTTCCVIDEAGVVVTRTTFESTEENWLAFVKRWPCKELKVALETGTMTWWVVDALRSADLEPVVVDPRQFKAIAASKKKSDKRDAQALAEGLRNGSADRCAVTVPSEKARRGRALLRARLAVVKQATMSRNSAKAMLRSIGLKLEGRRWTRDDAWSEVVNDDAVPQWMRELLEVFRTLWRTAQEQRKALDQRIAEELTHWPEAAHLREIAGYGPQVLLAVASSVDNPERFSSAHKVGSYGGLAPTVRDSGEKSRRGGITREGSAMLRFYMVQAAQSALKSKALSPSLRRWATRLMARRGRQVAVVALARRLLELGYRLFRTGEVYDPNFGAAVKA